MELTIREINALHKQFDELLTTIEGFQSKNTEVFFVPIIKAIINASDNISTQTHPVKIEIKTEYESNR